MAICGSMLLISKTWIADNLEEGATMRDTNLEDPDGKNIEKDAHLSVNTYKIIGPPPESLDDRPAAASQNIHPDVNAVAKIQKRANKPLTPQPPSHVAWNKKTRRFTENPTRFYAAIGVGLGVLLGVIFATVSLYTGILEGRNDLGPVISSGIGLTGHLYIKWEKTLQYRLTFEANDPEQQAGFALAIANPPRPLSIEIQLQDAKGVVLCSREIVLRYDARSAAIAANLPNKPPPAIDFAHLKAQEQEREQGKDIFQNQIAPDGHVASINAQGEIPCSMKAYENTTQWSFSTNFPSLAEQDELLERRHEMRANAAQGSAVHKKSAARAAEKLLPFSVEGDDMIVEFDVKSGVIVTKGRNTFVIDKTSAQSADPVWQEYPVSIHFRCSQSSNCTLMHAGVGALYAKQKR
jgi:hypothetical protein